jgi:hypothetical protein
MQILKNRLLNRFKKSFYSLYKDRIRSHNILLRTINDILDDTQKKKFISTFMLLDDSKYYR